LQPFIAAVGASLSRLNEPRRRIIPTFGNAMATVSSQLRGKALVQRA